MADDLKEVLVRTAELTAGPEPNFVNAAGAAVLRNGGLESDNFPNLEIKEHEVALYQSQVVNIDTLVDEINNAYKRSCDPRSARFNPEILKALQKGIEEGTIKMHCDFSSTEQRVMDRVDFVAAFNKGQLNMAIDKHQNNGRIDPKNIPDALYAAIEKWARIRAGYWDIEKYQDYCGLCYWVISRYLDPEIYYARCEKFCPLFSSGQCSIPDSFVAKVGKEYDILIATNKETDFVDHEDHSHTYLIDAIDNMITELQRLAAEHA